MKTKELFHFIQERHAIALKRAAGKPKPWTTDPVLQNYRFCNVYRELDTVTQWVAKEWRAPRAHDTNLWFAMVVARLVNWPDTLRPLTGSVLGTTKIAWRPRDFVRVLHARRAAGDKVFSAAYIVSTNGHAMDKAEYLAERVLTPLWSARKSVAPRDGDTLDSFHQRLMEYAGMGSFMAAQVVADMKHTKGGPLADAADWWTWAASGPGSRRGLNWVCRRERDAPWNEQDWRATLSTLQASVDPYVQKLDYPRIHAQDLQNCLCELGKMLRDSSRSKYPGSTNA